MSKNLKPELARGPYQCLDSLSPEDFAALEADILERGVLIPIEFDEDGSNSRPRKNPREDGGLLLGAFVKLR